MRWFMLKRSGSTLSIRFNYSSLFMKSGLCQLSKELNSFKAFCFTKLNLMHYTNYYWKVGSKMDKNPPGVGSAYYSSQISLQLCNYKRRLGDQEKSLSGKIKLIFFSLLKCLYCVNNDCIM